MAATVEGVFRILDRASDPMKNIKRAAIQTDVAVKELGKTLDRTGSARGTAGLKTLEKATKDVGQQASKTAAAVSASSKAMGSSVERGSKQAVRRLELLNFELKRVEREITKNKEYDIGTGIAEAKISILKRQIREVNQEVAKSQLGTLAAQAGAAASALGGGGGGLGGIGGGGGGMGMAGAMSLVVAAIGGLLPAVVALTGALSGLIGSLGAAVGGAGALGGGIFGAAAVGLGSIFVVMKQGMGDLKNAKKAQDDYNKAVKQYGRDSSQAATAKKTMDSAFSKSPGLKNAINDMRKFGAEWRKAIAPSSKQFGSLLGTGMQTLVKLQPALAAAVNRSFAAASGAMRSFLVELRGSDFRKFLDAMSRTFAAISGPAVRAFAEIGRWFGFIAQAASPYVIEFFHAFERWALRLSGRARDIGHVRKDIGGLIDHLKVWARFGAAAVRLMGAFFGAAAEPGKGMVASITATFDRWTSWLRKHPAELKSFFDRTIASAGKMVGALGQIARALGKIGDAMLPLLNMASDLVNALGPALPGLIGLAGTGLVASKLAGLAGAAGAAGAGGGGGGLGGAGLVAGGLLAGAGGGAAAAGGAGLGGAASYAAGTYGLARGFGYGRAASAGAAGMGTLQNLGNAARGSRAAALAGRAGTFLRRAALLSFGIGALTTEGGLGARIQGGASSATAGLIPAPTSGGHKGEGERNVANFLGQASYQGGDPAKRMAMLNKELAHQRTQLKKSKAGWFEREAGLFGIGDAVPNKERVQKQVDMLLKERSMVRTQYLAQVRALKAAEAATKGANAFSDVTGVFGVAAPRLGVPKAVQAVRKAYVSEFEKLSTDPRARGAMARASARWISQMERTGNITHKQATKMRQDIVREYDRIGKHVTIVNGAILTGSRKEWAGIKDALVSNTEKMRQQVSDKFTAVQLKAIGSLTSMGIPAATARKLVYSAEKGDARAAEALQRSDPSQTGKAHSGTWGSGATKARGGRIPGQGLNDTVPVGPSGVIAAPGELIVNRHTEARINGMLSRFQTSLASEVSGEHRPHNAPEASGINLRRMGLQRAGYGKRNPSGGAVFGADGGYGGPFGSGSGFIPLTEYAKKGGLSPTSGRTNHGTNTIYGSVSDHSWGGAVDYSNGGSPTPQMDAFAKFMGWTGGGTTSGPTFPPSKQIIYRTMMGGNHFNHVHTALDRGWAFSPSKMASWINQRGGQVAGGYFGAGGTGQGISLKVPTTGMGGATGAIGDRALSIMTRGLEWKVNKALTGTAGGTGTGLIVRGKVSTFGPPGEAAGNTATGVSSALPGVAINPNGGNFLEGRKYLNKNWRITIGGRTGVLKQTDLGPAGWTGRRIDVTGAGAQQMGFAPGAFPTDSIGTAELLAARGRRVPRDWHGWYAGGGQFVATRPGQIGVGEGGAETVKVTPRGRQAAYGKRKPGTVHVHIDKIEWNKSGDVRAAIEEEFRALRIDLATVTMDED